MVIIRVDAHKGTLTAVAVDDLGQDRRAHLSIDQRRAFPAGLLGSPLAGAAVNTYCYDLWGKVLSASPDGQAHFNLSTLESTMAHRES